MAVSIEGRRAALFARATTDTLITSALVLDVIERPTPEMAGEL